MFFFSMHSTGKWEFSTPNFQCGIKWQLSHWQWSLEEEAQHSEAFSASAPSRREAFPASLAFRASSSSAWDTGRASLDASPVVESYREAAEIFE
jgi:hypothetical protein